MEMTSNTKHTMVSMDSPKVSKGNKYAVTHEHHEGAVLSAHSISYVVQVPEGCCKGSQEKQILTDISAVFQKGMNAIMGPTGCGKSSFLDVLAGRKDPRGVIGTLLLDGKPVPDNFKCMVGYVVQDDVVMGTLTVRENFAFSAALRLPTSVGADERREKVEQVVKELGLQKCADTRVGSEFIRGVSGGERKRCNIGMELIISPPVLFLDEPTTGLDANTANVVLKFLRRLSRRGRTIIFSIHQPRYSIYRLFDNLLLLSHGHTVFHGPAPEALTFFEQQGFHCQEHNNPPDFFLDVINGDEDTLAADVNDNMDAEIDTDDHLSHHNKLIAGFKKSVWHQRAEQNASEIYQEFEKQGGLRGIGQEKVDYATSFPRQMLVLAKRSVRNMMRSPETIGATIGSSILFSIMVSTIFWQLDEDPLTAFGDREGVMFFLILNQLFFNMPAVEIFINERKIFMHENSSGFYRVSTYFFIKVFFDLLPLRLVPAFITSTIVYFSIGLRDGADYYFLFTFSMFMTVMTAACVCFLVSSLIRVFSVAQLALAFIYILMSLFGGFLISLDSIPDWLSWMQYGSILKYGMAVLYINEMKDREFCNGTICEYGNTRLEIADIDYQDDWDLYKNFVAMFGMSIALLILTYIRLRTMKKTT